ncbi:hypothetical protein [Mameliella alba]|uniref:hypothetical protein n=1 Tax=Mameliella alba TaxID=561184 RepID=UPI000B52CBC9|nr:hypothetical protein [Mameliella alba]OWV44242.1 hypothetical protein CDZ95_06030 [Mameliella alba]
MSDDLKERLRANALDECDEAIDLIATLESQLAAAEADRDAAVAAALEEAAGVAQDKHAVAMQWASHHLKEFDGKTDSLRIAEEIRALIPQSGADALERARAVAVKPLVWEKGVVDWARPMPGMKYVACSTTPVGSWAWWIDGSDERGVLPSEQAAKAAAQADYEKRIRSALVHVTPNMLAQARAAGMREAHDLAKRTMEAAEADGECSGATIAKVQSAILAAIENGEG